MISCFEEFEERFGSEVAAEVLSLVCETYYAARCSKTKTDRVSILSSESLDQEGANHRFSGEVRYRGRCYDFTIQDGNWDGTVVEEWARCYHHPCRPVPAQSIWMLQPARTMAALAAISLGQEWLPDQITKMLMKVVNDGTFQDWRCDRDPLDKWPVAKVDCHFSGLV